MAKPNFIQTYYQPVQRKSGKTLLAVGGFLLMVGIAYYIYRKAKKGKEIKGSIKSLEPRLPVWSNLRNFDLASKITIKSSKDGAYITNLGVGSYLGEATGRIEKGSDGMYYREIVPPTNRKDMFKNSNGSIISKAYVLAKVTGGFA